jgi:Ni/Co efflux regulator RcnB
MTSAHWWEAAAEPALDFEAADNFSNDRASRRSHISYQEFTEGSPMNNKTLIASLALVAGLAGIAPIVQADDPPQKTVQPGVNNTRALVVGDRAPDVYQRSEKALGNWKQKGLKAPKDQAQWVQINDKYMMVMITNGMIVDITPVER